MLLLSQRDPRWASHKLGASDLTIGAYGCTTTALSMLTSYFHCFKDPIEIQSFQDYTPDGLILWDTLRLAPFHFIKRIYGQHDDEIQNSITDPNLGCIIEVSLSSGGHHWLVATGKVPLVDAYFVVDPWDAKKKTTLAYKNKITGSAHYSNKV